MHVQMYPFSQERGSYSEVGGRASWSSSFTKSSPPPQKKRPQRIIAESNACLLATDHLANADAYKFMQGYSWIDKTDKTVPRCNVRNLRAICLPNTYAFALFVLPLLKPSQFSPMAHTRWMTSTRPGYDRSLRDGGWNSEMIKRGTDECYCVISKLPHI